MDVLLICAIVSIICTRQYASSCSNICWFAYYNPTGNFTPGSETRIQPNKTLTGVVTIDAEYIADPAAWEYLRFMKDDGNQALVIQIYSGEPGVSGKVRLFPEDDAGAIYNGMFSHEQVFTEQKINIQISDVNMVMNRAYQLYLGTPGEALSVTYGYKHSYLWDRFSGTRLNNTNTIKGDDKATVIKSVSVCEHAQPKLCNDHETEVLVAVMGESYNLSCSGSGSPYMTATWRRDPNNDTIEEAIETYDNSTADNFIKSTLVIDSFSTSHIGSWSCYIENKNFGFTAKKTYIFTMVKSPENTTYYYSETEEVFFTWILQRWAEKDQINDSKTYLDCGKKFPNLMKIKYTKNSSSLEQEVHLVFKKGTKIDLLKCTLYYMHDASTENIDQSYVLDSVNITRVGYNCVAGQYGVKDLCLPCPMNQTSSNGSTECRSVAIDNTNNESVIIIVVIIIAINIVGICIIILVIIRNTWMNNKLIYNRTSSNNLMSVSDIAV